jgi:predicted aspartyl protease
LARVSLLHWLPLCLLVGCAPAIPGSTPQVCSIVKAAEVPLRIERGFVVAPATIEDSAVTLLIDTGSEGSLVTPGAVARLHLQRDSHNRTTIRGIGGSISTQNARLQSFGIGGMVMMDQSTAVGPVGPASGAALQVSGLLGADWLSDFDVDFDLPRRVMTLYRVQGCTGDYVPWQGPMTSIPARLYGRGLLVLPSTLDGQPVAALLDSGADASVVAEAVAARAGADAAAMAHDPVGHGIGVDGNPQDLHRHRFGDLQVGAEHFHDVTIAVSELHNTPADMLLGIDWLRSHRLWIAYAARRVFVQHR